MSAQAPTAAVAPRRRYARWRPRAALVAIVIGFILSQAVALAVTVVAGSHRGGIGGSTAVALVLADAVPIAVVVAFARRGAERLTPATLGIRRTAFGPSPASSSRSC